MKRYIKATSKLDMHSKFRLQQAVEEYIESEFGLHINEFRWNRKSRCDIFQFSILGDYRNNADVINASYPELKTYDDRKRKMMNDIKIALLDNPEFDEWDVDARFFRYHVPTITMTHI